MPDLIAERPASQLSRSQLWRSLLLLPLLAPSLLGGALLLALSARAQAQGESPAEADPPNILFAFADDWGAHAGAYGTKGIDTPTFDRVAGEGVLFKRAFASAPSCTPSRGAVLTGQHIWRLGPGANLHSTLLAELPVYPRLLEEEAGYFVGHTRKGWGPGRLQPGDRTERPSGPSFESFAAFLKARSESDPDAPFAFWFGSTDPHRNYNDSLRKAMNIDPASVEVPPYLPDVPTVRRDIAKYYAEVQRFDREVGRLLDRLEAAGKLDNTIVVMSGDHGWPFPRRKSNLYDAGTQVPLAIRWPEGAEGSGRRVTGFVNLVDLAPTFLKAAGLFPPEQMTGRSLMPVLRSSRERRVAAHRSHVLLAKERHHGRSRPDSSGYPSRAIRTERFLYIRNFKPDRWPAGAPTIRSSQGIFSDTDAGPTKRWMIEHADELEVQPIFRLSFGKRPAEELYDLREDPHQMQNVAGDPDYAAVREHLWSVLEGELRALGDPRPAGGGERFDEYPYYTGYGMKQVEPPASVKKALRSSFSQHHEDE